MVLDQAAILGEVMTDEHFALDVHFDAFRFRNTLDVLARFLE